ncbi:MAG TPA: hypothetical protein VHQ01_07920 [Pyrinomonadaceae bacterium]|nr:hypothetical protein [Pyrinomonadaceae bacterium]
MSERFNQYKQSDTRKIGYRWVIFDNEMPHEILLEFTSKSGDDHAAFIFVMCGA